MEHVSPSSELSLQERKQQQQPGKAEEAVKQKPCFSEGEVLQLAQRYFLSPAVAKEAYEVFLQYCAMEQQLPQRQRCIVMAPSVPSRKATEVSTVFSPTAVREDGGEAMPCRLDMPHGEKAAAATVEGKKEDGRIDTATVWTSALVSGRHTLPGDGERQQEGKDGATSPDAEKEVGEEVTLGVEGLQQFLNDLGMRMSALEVADLVHDLNDDPIDFVLRRRAMAAAAAAASEAEAQASAVGGSSAGQGATTKSATSTKAGASRRKDNSAVTKSGKEAHSESAWSGDRGEELSVSVSKRSVRDGVTFSLFLFILSHVLLEKEDNTEMRDCEVRDLFHLVDADKDGVISVRDIQTVIQRLMDEGAAADDRDLQKLYAMSMVELETALAECDVDDDGRVTLEDMYGVLRS
ncbi:hypothetical protein TraAM80_07412 [Trypanosoma rangeli]|uniref:EF-hand domain-containing protein n=1 Tax=Trypanosoma rangeli TaxID=5698 RepID=A0A422N5L8_TRYRA|nr:uncharacterized protein TraAM80_07412 [Trypanosoma rangeli]RNF00758.1 hypothetical protein TraAM80_07412 [Trypanosoma rangeli]|eukprot:RNF00758.1 hypothetical protein TraAM80_07412 [Trypanosoma rangeli]